MRQNIIDLLDAYKAAKGCLEEQHIISSYVLQHRAEMSTADVRLWEEVQLVLAKRDREFNLTDVLTRDLKERAAREAGLAAGRVCEAVGYPSRQNASLEDLPEGSRDPIREVLEQAWVAAWVAFGVARPSTAILTKQLDILRRVVGMSP